MKGLDQAGMGATLDSYNIRVGGHVEMSWTHNFDDPVGGVNVGRVFDFEHDDHTFNQLDLFIEKTVTASGSQFDWGGRMEWIWGGDARFIHANGVFDHYGFPLFPGSPNTGDGPDEQFDPVQFYLDFNIPVGNGILVRGGKFVTPFGYETINPITNPLYSHSFLFNFAIPFTHTGITATYQIDPNWSGMVGVVRGWDQSFEDNNGVHSYMGQLKYTSEKLDFIVGGIIGPEQFEDNQNWRHLLDFTVIYREGDNLQFVLNGDYGWEDSDFPGLGDGEWWGAAGYVILEFNDYLTGCIRAEYFSDHDGLRGTGTEFHEITAGVTIHPFPRHEWFQGLAIRPEVRWDHATDDVFDGGDDDNQITIGGDIIFAF
jgi:hypothetical protein